MTLQTSDPQADQLVQATMTIAGVSVPSLATFPVIDPATAQPFAQAPDCSHEQLELAVDSAAEAFTRWSTSSDAERRAALVRIGDVLERHRDEIARLITREQGKPLAKSHGEINSALAWIRAYAEMDLPVEVVRDSETAYAEIRRVPLGVVAGITAWNYPVLLAVWKFAPAIRTGNTVVIKPSPLTPIATLRLGELLTQVLEPGVLNVICGGDEIGRALVAHPRVRKVSFTGSTATGRAIMQSAGRDLKRLTLELGGNDAGIVLPGTDPASVAEELFWAAFSNCGQVCAGLKRLYVPADQVDAFTAALADVAARVVVAPGLDPESQIGPVQNLAQLERVRELLADAREHGAEVVFEGAAPEGGYFHPVTLVRDVAEGVRLVDEEQFGPVLPILSYTTVEEAVARANDSDFGLGGSVWGPDPEAAREVATRLQAGAVSVGQHPGMGPDLPFGGVKQSGVGVESSRYGLAAFTDIQTVLVNRDA